MGGGGRGGGAELFRGWGWQGAVALLVSRYWSVRTEVGDKGGVLAEQTQVRRLQRRHDTIQPLLSKPNIKKMFSMCFYIRGSTVCGLLCWKIYNFSGLNYLLQRMLSCSTNIIS